MATARICLNMYYGELWLSEATVRAEASARKSRAEASVRFSPSAQDGIHPLAIFDTIEKKNI